MADLLAYEKQQKSCDNSESLTPSSLLDQSHGELISESPFSTHAGGLAWLLNSKQQLTSDQSDTSLHCTEMSDSSTDQSEDLQQLYEMISEEMLNVDPDAALFPLLEDEPRHQQPVNMSKMYSRQQEKNHQQIYPATDSISTCPSVGNLPSYPAEDAGSSVPSDAFHFPKCPDLIMSHYPPALGVSAQACSITCDCHTAIPPQNFSHFICVPQLLHHHPPAHRMNTNYSSSQQNISYPPLMHLLEPNRTCPMHQAKPSHFFPPSHVVVGFPPDVHENYRLWQRYCERAKAFYSSSPHVQALACFFTHAIGSLAVHLSHDAAVMTAALEWKKKSPPEREQYYTSAMMFIQLEEQERRCRRAHTGRGCDLQSSTKHTSTVTPDIRPAQEHSEVTDRSKVTAGHQVNAEECVQYLNEPYGRRDFITEVFRPQGRHQNGMFSVNSTKTHQNMKELSRNNKRKKRRMRSRTKLKHQRNYKNKKRP